MTGIHHHSIIQTILKALKILGAPPIHPSPPLPSGQPVILYDEFLMSCCQSCKIKFVGSVYTHLQTFYNMLAIRRGPKNTPVKEKCQEVTVYWRKHYKQANTHKNISCVHCYERSIRVDLRELGRRITCSSFRQGSPGRFP